MFAIFTNKTSMQNLTGFYGGFFEFNFYNSFFVKIYYFNFYFLGTVNCFRY